MFSGAGRRSVGTGAAAQVRRGRSPHVGDPGVLLAHLAQAVEEDPHHEDDEGQDHERGRQDRGREAADEAGVDVLEDDRDRDADGASSTTSAAEREKNTSGRSLQQTGDRQQDPPAVAERAQLAVEPGALLVVDRPRRSACASASRAR